MYVDNRPLEMLTAFAITFIAGMASAAALGTYAHWLKNRVRSAPAN